MDVCARLNATSPDQINRIRDLRDTDEAFDEACQDFEDLSTMLEQLDASGDPELATIAASSLYELGLEITERLKSVSDHDA